MNFFKTFLASFTAILAAGFVLLLVVLLSLAGLLAALSQAEDRPSIKPHSVLTMQLNDPIVEHARPDPLEFDFNELLPSPFSATVGKMGLFEINQALQAAAKDPNIDGLYLKLSPALTTGWASLQAIRQNLQVVQDSGKFIYAYAEIYTEKTYYLASVADSVFMPEPGMLEFNGISAVPIFYKGLFDKLELKPLVFRVGTYKSAVEPYLQESMSEASREQTQALIQDLWGVMAEEVAASRRLATAQLDSLAEAFIFGEAREAVAAGLVDQVLHEEAVIEKLKKTLGIFEQDALREVELKDYLRATAPNSAKAGTPKVAVIFADGTIQGGKSTDGVIGGETLMRALRQAREDKDIKAVVLRINSPGGSALVSDLISGEVTRLANEKPLVASMGDYAASGGYYIAAKCDKIFAQKNTITGSIGTFAILFNAKNMLDHKLGLTFDHVESHSHADLGNPVFPLTESEKQFLQARTERVYQTFLEVVKAGRDFETLEEVDEVGQGRVWSGERALALRLVDQWGSLEDAIDEAASLSGLGDEAYELHLSPKAQSPMEELMKQMGNAQVESLPLGAELGALLELKKRIPRSGTYALMPFVMDIQ